MDSKDIPDVQDIPEMYEKQEKHEFHFVIARRMKEKLKELHVFEKSMGFSKTVTEILAVLRPVIQVEHKWGEQRMSRYRYVSDDKDEKRDHVCAYMDEDVYRELKLIHQDLNFYSISQIIRGFLEFFLDLVEEYGADVFKELKKVYKRWEELARECRLTLREEVRQLFNILPIIEGGNGNLTIYDHTFTPLYFLRL
jgi:ferredoxin-thioredoxin reductase catalytic subunit